MRKQAVFFILSAILFCVPSYADFVMKITADDTELAIGETTTVRVYGYAEEATAGNGLYDWSVSVLASQAGIVQAHSAVILAPTPLDIGNSGSTLNVGGAGNVDASALISVAAHASEAGVGDYTELLNFVIEGIAAGQVTYSLAEIWGDLFDLTTNYDPKNANVVFNQADSVGTITVVPEPTSLLLLAGLSAMGYLGRKKR